MKINLESTKWDRLRLLLGGVIAFGGLATLTIGGIIFRFENIWVWIIGGGALIGGLLLAGSMRLIHELTH